MGVGCLCIMKISASTMCRTQTPHILVVCVETGVLYSTTSKTRKQKGKCRSQNNTSHLTKHVVVRRAAAWDSIANASTQTNIGTDLVFLSPNFGIVRDFGCGTNWIKDMMGVLSGWLILRPPSSLSFSMPKLENLQCLFRKYSSFFLPFCEKGIRLLKNAFCHNNLFHTMNRSPYGKYKKREIE